MFSPLDQILVDEEVSELNIQLLKLSKSVDIQLIATKKGTHFFPFILNNFCLLLVVLIHVLFYIYYSNLFLQ